MDALYCNAATHYEPTATNFSTSKNTVFLPDGKIFIFLHNGKTQPLQSTAHGYIEITIKLLVHIWIFSR